MPSPAEPAALKDDRDITDLKSSQKVVGGNIISKADATDPTDHGAVVAAKALKFLDPWCPGLAAMQHRVPD